MSNDQYRIEYTITRYRPGKDDDFTEIGFGSSGSWSSIDQCAHMVNSAVQNKDWETSKGMPDPDTVEADEDDAPAYPIFGTPTQMQKVLERIPDNSGGQCHA